MTDHRDTTTPPPPVLTPQHSLPSASADFILPSFTLDSPSPPPLSTATGPSTSVATAETTATENPSLGETSTVPKLNEAAAAPETPIEVDVTCTAARPVPDAEPGGDEHSAPATQQPLAESTSTKQVVPVHPQDPASVPLASSSPSPPPVDVGRLLATVQAQDLLLTSIFQRLRVIEFQQDLDSALVASNTTRLNGLHADLHAGLLPSVQQIQATVETHTTQMEQHASRIERVEDGVAFLTEKEMPTETLIQAVTTHNPLNCAPPYYPPPELMGDMCKRFPEFRAMMSSNNTTLHDSLEGKSGIGVSFTLPNGLEFDVGPKGYGGMRRPQRKDLDKTTPQASAGPSHIPDAVGGISEALAIEAASLEAPASSASPPPSAHPYPSPSAHPTPALESLPSPRPTPPSESLGSQNTSSSKRADSEKVDESNDSFVTETNDSPADLLSSATSTIDNATTLGDALELPHLEESAISSPLRAPSLPTPEIPLPPPPSQGYRRRKLVPVQLTPTPSSAVPPAPCKPLPPSLTRARGLTSKLSPPPPATAPSSSSSFAGAKVLDDAMPSSGSSIEFLGSSSGDLSFGGNTLPRASTSKVAGSSKLLVSNTTRGSTSKPFKAAPSGKPAPRRPPTSSSSSRGLTRQPSSRPAASSARESMSQQIKNPYPEKITADGPVRKRRRTERERPVPQRRDALLPMGDGQLNGRESEWPKIPRNYAQWLMQKQEVACDKCDGRVHWACAGFALDQASVPAPWYCPDCQFLLNAGREDEIRRAPPNRCARHDCCRRRKVKLEVGSGDELEWTMSTPTSTLWREPSSPNRIFEYLVEWQGYSIDESTWEPAENLHHDKDGTRPAAVRFINEAKARKVNLKTRIALLPEPAILAAFDPETGELRQLMYEGES